MTPLARPYRAVTLALVLITTMIAFEAMAITTAMPQAALELSADGSYGLAFSAMMTAMLAGIVLAGPWADAAGPVPPLYAGGVLFVVGTIGCAVAPTWLALLGGRVLTGLGAGLVVIAEFVAIGRVYPATLRPAVFTWISAAWVVPSVLGAPVAGWLTTIGSWRWVFWVVVAPAVAALALVATRRRALGGPGEAPTSADRADHRRIAVLGAVVAVSAGVVQLAIHEQTTSPLMLALAASGLAGLVVAVPRLLPAGSLTGRSGLPSVVASRGLYNGSFMAMVTYVPLLLHTSRGLSLTAAGGVVAAASLGWSAGSWLQGRLPTGFDRPRLVWSGAGLLASATGMLTAATALQWPIAVTVGALVAAGLAMGTGSTTLSVLILDLAAPAEHGRASSALQLSDVLGSVVGIGAATTVYGVLLARGDLAFTVVFGLLTAFAALAIVTGLRISGRTVNQPGLT